MELRQLAALITLLEQVRRRPGMFLGGVEHQLLWAYLDGLYTGFELLDHKPDLAQLHTILHERGWRTDTALGAYPDMREKGLSAAAIIDQELAIHIELWQRIYRSLSESDG